MAASEHGYWTVFVPGVTAGQRYGFRADGDHDPRRGLFFDPNKLLVDPRARAISGRLHWQFSIFAADREQPGAVDTAPLVPKSVVVAGDFDWDDDRSPRTPLEQTVIYECHVRGLTMLHPRIQPSLRGTYLGLCQEPVIEHLRGLGVTAVELMPVLHHETEHHLAAQSRHNYWGYSPLGFFAPHAGYATTAGDRPVREFKHMVRELHRAGIEVILDVVYNHTVEGSELGAAISLRGLDGPSYYRSERNGDGTWDFSGCGNTLHAGMPAVRELVLDSLRYWTEEMHVDGFRFDLATILGRPDVDFEPHRSLIQQIADEPSLAEVKLIAEPWDLGPGGYQLGAFPHPWSEWNDRFRISQRAFWRGDRDRLLEIAAAFDGSNDLFTAKGRGATSSINYVTSHDGLTLDDLVSYEHKNNWANGEDNRDGADRNYSRNWGVEGPTASPTILGLRLRIKKNLLASLAFSRGVPMIGHGDEMGRTQRGNNNPYLHDDETTWVDWRLDDDDRALLAFCREVFRLRATHPVLQAARSQQYASWLRPDGREMQRHDWKRSARTLVAAWQLIEGAEHAGRVPALALAMNAGDDPRVVVLPWRSHPGRWHRLVDSTGVEPGLVTTSSVRLVAHSLALFEFEPWRPRREPA